MENAESISLRLRYEAFSKYAASISKCQEIADLAQVLVKHIKYLMPFNFGRVLLFKDQYFYEILYINQKTEVTIGEDVELRGFEKTAVETMIPQLKNCTDVDFDLLSKTFEGFGLENRCFEQLSLVPLTNSVVYTALFGFSSKTNQFISQIDNQFAKLILDLFVTKFSEIKLSIDTQVQKEIIENNFKIISDKNLEIEQVLVNQENLIKKRTMQLEARNTVLEEYSWITSHEIRRPLANILGLVQLADHDLNDPENLREVISLLKNSALELDEEVKRANMLLAERT
ncbi:histidine kinase [Pedobacter arcticus]|uniref:histidine kinase n=1 Tax=Pedobacter arcticus TaxID=752140 RepID=UPI0002FE8A09|nr:histidine kinase [Pedobacter arcticus]